jgi:phosphoglycolate phosphatase
MQEKLFLFDIDQTLILTKGAGRKALEKAFEKFFQISNSLQKITTSGKTDTLILREMAQTFGVSILPEQEKAIWTCYLSFLEKELRESKNGIINPGIPEILNALDDDPNAFLGLLTGNIYEGAKIKLSHFNLWHYFPVGGFGDDHYKRNKVAEIALKRSRNYYKINFPSENVFVIGDSLLDIQCANAIHAKSVIVATGNDSYEMLKAQNPSFLFENFMDAQKVLACLQGNSSLKKKNFFHSMPNFSLKVVLENPAQFLNPFWYEQLNGINWIENGEPLVAFERIGPVWNPRFPNSLFLNHNIKRLHLVLLRDNQKSSPSDWEIFFKEIFSWHERTVLYEKGEKFKPIVAAYKNPPAAQTLDLELEKPSFLKLQKLLGDAAWVLLPEGDGFSLFFIDPIEEELMNKISHMAKKFSWEIQWIKNLYDFHKNHAR